MGIWLLFFISAQMLADFCRGGHTDICSDNEFPLARFGDNAGILALFPAYHRYFFCAYPVQADDDDKRVFPVSEEKIKAEKTPPGQGHKDCKHHSDGHFCPARPVFRRKQRYPADNRVVPEYFHVA